MKPKKIKLKEFAESIIKQKLNEASLKIDVEDCVPDRKYEVGYRSHRWVSTFVGWKLDRNGPRMVWKDADEKVLEWEAYMYKGFMAVGSSADKLIIYREV